ncbi:hypothetical protein NE237_017877 [Protea cynaroides]|uniref:FAR1 domain-containing protein n=1 Tax=Protea cynaroides TaxID=273540 RepID=A0A9Q0QNH1_9MAGN|nr:hypothetical protein NE237_017877 [Protea cynaroides]
MDPLFIECSSYGEGNGLECGENDADLVGRESDSDEEFGDIGTGSEVAFERYVRYAKAHGFAVRKQRTFNRDWGDRVVYRKDFVCFKACSGENKTNATGDSVHTNKETTHNDIDNTSKHGGIDGKKIQLSQSSLVFRGVQRTLGSSFTFS